MPRHPLPILGFNDLAVDDEWESPCRTITEADVVHFACLSGDFNPLHLDYEAARQGPFGKPVAHGLLGLAVVSGLASQAPRVETLAFLGIVEWKFLQPIAFGDTVRVISRVVALEPRAQGRRGVVTWYRKLVNQSEETVQEGRTQTLVRARRDLPDEPERPTG
jgi:3-hydroxybutyryl-CoA dehydratase